MRLTRLPGGGAGPPVAMLAGIVGGCALFRETGEALASAGFPVALLDTAGDRRDDPGPPRLSWDFLAEEVVRGIDALGPGPAILYGTSYGCLVALATAARFPARVRALLLAHPPDPYGRPFHLPALRWGLAQKDPVRTVGRLFQLFFTCMVGWEFAVPTALLRARALVAAATEAATPARTLHDKLALLWDEPPGLPAAPGLPVSIVAGPWDVVAPLSGARGWQARLPGSHLRVLRFSGHSGHFSRPKSFARIVVEEARRLAEASG